MILVVADDVTGAAEMGGIAWREGLSATVVRETAVPDAGQEADVVVLDTDSRLMAAPDAAEHVGKLVSEAVKRLAPRHVFKKIDSAFRGPVGAELEACLVELGYDRALVVVASPATGRYTVAGVHYVAGRPLAESEFGRDEVHPASNSHLPTVLSAQMNVEVTAATDPGQIAAGRAGVIVGDARTDEDIAAWAGALRESSLPVGSATFGRALLSAWHKPGLAAREVQDIASVERGPTLIVSGSRSEASHRQMQLFDQSGGAVVQLDGAKQRAAKELVLALRETGAALLTVPRRKLWSSDLGARGVLAERLAQVAADVMEEVSLHTLVAVGGHTAGCVLGCLGWSVLSVVGEFGQGVVALRPEQGSIKQVILKPGSYGDDDFYVRLAGY